MDKTPVPQEVQDNNIILSESDEQKCIEELRILIKGLCYIIYKLKKNNLSRGHNSPNPGL